MAFLRAILNQRSMGDVFDIHAALVAAFPLQKARITAPDRGVFRVVFKTQALSLSTRCCLRAWTIEALPVGLTCMTDEERARPEIAALFTARLTYAATRALADAFDEKISRGDFFSGRVYLLTDLIKDLGFFFAVEEGLVVPALSLRRQRLNALAKARSKARRSRQQAL